MLAGLTVCVCVSVSLARQQGRVYFSCSFNVSLAGGIFHVVLT